MAESRKSRSTESKSEPDPRIEQAEAHEQLEEAQTAANQADAKVQGQEMQKGIDQELAGSASPALAPDADLPAPGMSESKQDDAEKISVKTTGPFMIHDPYTSNTVEPGDEPTEVVRTSFIMDKIASGQLIEA